MLGNHADAFFTTPMKTTISTQAARAAGAPEMPSPRPLSQSATATTHVNEFLPGMGNPDMLPGMGGDMLPGMGGIMDTVRDNMLPIGVIGGLFLLCTKPGKRMLKKVGIG